MSQQSTLRIMHADEIFSSSPLPSFFLCFLYDFLFAIFGRLEKQKPLFADSMGTNWSIVAH